MSPVASRPICTGTPFTERSEQPYFYSADKIGSIVALTDAAGNSVCSYSYDSFGRTPACNAITNPFAFAGREYDSESGLIYMRARYYDPATGRFISPDPLDLPGLILGAQYGGPGSAYRLRRSSSMRIATRSTTPWCSATRRG